MRPRPCTALEFALSRPTSVTWGREHGLVVPLITSPQPTASTNHGWSTKPGVFCLPGHAAPSNDDP